MSRDTNSGGDARRRKLRLGFGPRLALALGLTLVLVTGVGSLVMARVLEIA